MTTLIKTTPLPPEKRRKTEVGDQWTWRTARGEALRPADMETRHLMNVVLMVWNNTVPEHMQTHDDVVYYNFPHHEPEYLKQAVRYMFMELEGRDLSEVKQVFLDRWNIMRSWLTQPEFYEQYGITERRAITHAP